MDCRRLLQTGLEQNCSRRVAAPSAPQRRQHAQRQATRTHAAQQQGEGLGDSVKRLARQVAGSIPVIGLISRLTSSEGGIGNDTQAYPEYCRTVFEAAPEGFQVAVAELQNKHGKAAQRRYVLLALWMARHGAGVIPGKMIADAARRLRVSLDLEYEVDRFADEVAEVNAKYTYMQRPRGTPAQQADVAVDSLARLVLNLKDGEPVGEEDAALLEDCITGGFWDVPDMRAEVKRSIAERAQRASAYA